MNFTEKKLSGNTVYDGKILKLEVDEVLLPDGKKASRECVRHSGGAAVLYISEKGVLLVKQYRYLYGKELYEIPAGKVENGEDPSIAARRELEEETGLIAEEISHLLDLYPTPGYTDEVIRVYLAKRCKKGVKNLDEGEFLNAYFMPLDEVLKKIEHGEICDAKTVAAVYKYLYENK